MGANGFARQLRVVWDDEPAASVLPPGSDPRLGWTLDEFVEQWVPNAVWRPEKTDPDTVRGYYETLKYWRAIAGAPSLFDLANPQIGDAIGINFTAELPEWGSSCRGVPRGHKHRIARLEDCPSFRPLGEVTVRDHASRLRTLLRYAGPRLDPGKPAAGIMRACPYIPRVTAEEHTKPPFALAHARLIAAACARMTRPRLPAGWSPALWWQTRVAIFFYTGLRAGTVTALRWEHVAEIDGVPQLQVPGKFIKTGKPACMPLHEQLAALIAQLPRGAPADLLLPLGCDYSHFGTLHARLQILAGVPADDIQSPHAWRRTYIHQMGELGLGRSHEVARLAADHSDGRTTEKNYLGRIIVNQLRLQLPPLF